MRDDSKTVLRQKKHLAIPGVGVKRPAVRERNRGAGAPVLVVNLPSVFRSDSTHDTLLFLQLVISSFSELTRKFGFRTPDHQTPCEAVFAPAVDWVSQSSKRVSPSWAVSPGTMLRSLNLAPK